ncbi:hypothetical protein Aeqsu_2333 [Aequorivita sublithincola DSM 14238]|uniref:Lipoprotein n=1 Tax=Aequorivita sublithincola (strain DSM 14238 / LMG 21431 / ACAM 643 / 9-3) TaxID=746697 RepID=I3YXS5_AEQSU|nr:hypothetical protein [Aequorivita sublithincola]AFL81793.1 hypothetical protein Aeqsu_2333 [Aequorivita sublithincola DSM 14238]
MTTKMTNRFLLLIFTSLLFIACENPTHTEPPYEGPPKDNIISVEQAQEMYDAYSERRSGIIQKYEDSVLPSPEKFTPTRYAEYDLKTIKQYIAYIEHEAKEANVDINTLRFYLSNYPNSDKFPNGDVVKYPRRNSFFVVPTMSYKGENVGFSIEDIDGKYTAVPLKGRNSNEERTQDNDQTDSTGQMNEAGFFMSNNATVGETTSLILNDGTITPPPGNNPFDHGN